LGKPFKMMPLDNYSGLITVSAMIYDIISEFSRFRIVFIIFVLSAAGFLLAGPFSNFPI